jgi:hypothetical protein
MPCTWSRIQAIVFYPYSPLRRVMSAFYDNAQGEW